MLLVSWLGRFGRRLCSTRPVKMGRGRQVRRKTASGAWSVEELEVRLVLTPFASADSYIAAYDRFDTVAQAAPSVLANDYAMPPGAPLTAALVTGPANGSVTLNSNGHFVYTPTLGYAGSDSFTYKAFDGTSYSSPATVSLSVIKSLSARTNLEDRPSAGGTSFGAITASSFTGEVQAGQGVGDGETLSYESLSDPRPVIAVETTYSPTTPPSTFEVQLTLNGVLQPAVWYGVSATGATVRFAAQADATSLASGRYLWQMNIIGHYSGTNTATQTYSGNVEIVNLDASTFGNNWTVKELDRLVPQSGGALLVRGDGVTAWFNSTGGVARWAVRQDRSQR